MVPKSKFYILDCLVPKLAKTAQEIALDTTHSFSIQRKNMKRSRGTKPFFLALVAIADGSHLNVLQSHVVTSLLKNWYSVTTN